MNEIKYFIKKINHLEGINHGYANGYVAIPKNHKLYGIDYTSINFDIHGGLTFSQNSESCNDWEEIKDLKDYWIIGFDTCHYKDNEINCNKDFCENETKKLYNFVLNYKD